MSSKEKKSDKEKKKKTQGSKTKNFSTKKNMGTLFKLLPALSIFLLIIGLGLHFHKSMFSADYFNVNNTKLTWQDKLKITSSYKYDKLSNIGKGENIFKLNIKKIASKIISNYPEFKNCTIQRAFPNQLIVNIDVRQPVAQIDHDKYYLIDQDAILLSKGMSIALEGLPLIGGLKWKPPNKIGEKYNSYRLSKALVLLGAITSSGILNEHKLLRINASDHRNIRFFIDDELEVKIGHNNFRERLELLQETLSSTYIDKSDLEYIDLRFDDIVFGTK